MFDYPPHAFCLLQDPALIFAEALLNGLIALAYFAIPVTLVVLIRQTKLLPGSIFMMFAVFIYACGLTHVMRVVTLFWGGPWYILEVVVCAITVVASIATAVALATELPGLLRLFKMPPKEAP